MQEKILIANWKSHKTHSEASAWFSAFTHEISVQATDRYHMSVIVAAPAIYLDLAMQACKKTNGILIAAQDVSQFPLGSYTGAVAAQQLASLGVTHSLVGHSERRRYFGESSQIIAQKIEQLLENNMTPIVCVDEPEIQRQADLIPKELRQLCIVAYEPVSAIGTGMGEDVSQVSRVITNIKQVFGDIPVLYGGSVDERNIYEYLLVSDGALVGGASLDAKQFAQLLISASSKTSYST